MTDVQDRVADLTDRLAEAAQKGMTQAVWAQVQPCRFHFGEIEDVVDHCEQCRGGEMNSLEILPLLGL